MSDQGLITNEEAYAALCQRLDAAPRIALDTEFVPEYTFTPILCLVQVATDDLAVALDPLALPDLDRFWHLLVAPGREVVVHAGKEEMNFCLARTGRLPERLFDIQLAAGFVGFGYPTSYSNLAQKILDQSPHSGETRTDWRKRPLSSKQVAYALDDVRYLLGMRDRLGSLLSERGRAHWLFEETATVREQLENRDDSERWRRLAGAGSLAPRGLAILREIAQWRERRARQLDKPPKWILRDDLLAELARRQPSTLKELQSTRGIGSIGDGRPAQELFEAIDRGRKLPEAECPRRDGRRETPEEQMIVKILSAAMIHLARAEEVSPGLLGSNEDLRQFMLWQARGERPDEAPRLARGWRAEICGSGLIELLAGRTAVRIHNQDGDPRLIFDRQGGEV